MPHTLKTLHQVNIYFADPSSIQQHAEQNPFDTEKFLELFKTDPFLREQLEADSGVYEKYSLERHVAMVLRQNEKYYPNFPFLCKMPRSIFRIFLALHDIGKPLAHLHGHKNEQHKYSEIIITKTFQALEINECLPLTLALLNGDNIGSYLKGKISLDQSIAGLKKQFEISGVDRFQNFFDLLLIYYKCDAGAYTADAGGIASLDHLFIFDAETPEIRFSEKVMEKFSPLVEKIFSEK